MLEALDCCPCGVLVPAGQLCFTCPALHAGLARSQSLTVRQSPCAGLKQGPAPAAQSGPAKPHRAASAEALPQSAAPNAVTRAPRERGVSLPARPGRSGCRLARRPRRPRTAAPHRPPRRPTPGRARRRRRPAARSRAAPSSAPACPTGRTAAPRRRRPRTPAPAPMRLQRTSGGAFSSVVPRACRLCSRGRSSALASSVNQSAWAPLPASATGAA
jgi:hypothetical protein